MSVRVFVRKANIRPLPCLLGFCVSLWLTVLKGSCTSHLAHDNDKAGQRLNRLLAPDSTDILHVVSDGIGKVLDPLLHSYCMDHKVLWMEIDCTGVC